MNALHANTVQLSDGKCEMRRLNNEHSTREATAARCSRICLEKRENNSL